jgi:hypothetical protein
MNLKTPERRRQPHHPVLNHATNVNRSSTGKRRSSRMALHAPVGLSGQDRQKGTFTISARATNLNRHGAAVRLQRELAVGSVVEVENQRGTRVSARVVAHLSALEGISTYAIEFIEREKSTEDFWGILFPATNA